MAVVERVFEAKVLRAVVVSDRQTRRVDVETDGVWAAGIGVSDSGDLFVLATYRGRFGLVRVPFDRPRDVHFVAFPAPSKED